MKKTDGSTTEQSETQALTSEEINLYSRNIFLPQIGGAGQQKLKKARILIVGAGGLGSPVLTYLAAAGIGTIGIIDDDNIEISNLQRQFIHDFAQIGKPKADSAQRFAQLRNPYINIIPYKKRLSSENCKSIFEDYDIIADCSDNYATRYLITDLAASSKKPCVSGAISRFDGQVTVLAPYENNQPSYRDLFPVMVDGKAAGNCNIEGVIGAVAGIIGSVQALEIIKLVTQIGEPLIGKLFIYKGLQAQSYIINYTKSDL